MSSHSPLPVGLVLYMLLGLPSSWAAPRLTILPSLVAKHGPSTPTAVSDNGRIVVGSAWNQNQEERPVWYQNGKRPREIVPFLEQGTPASAVSADGLGIVGYAVSGASFVPYYWHREKEFININSDPNLIVLPEGISGDGHVVVGSFYGSGPTKAFRWTAERGFEPLEDPDPFTHSVAVAVTHDGNLIVGSAGHACRWLADGKLEWLGTLGGATSEAADVSPEGAVIVGVGQIADASYHAFRWTRESGVQRLETSARFSVATAVSGRGHIVGKYSTDPDSASAFLWTEQTGLRLMDELFRSALPPGSSFATAADISADGRWIVGQLVTENYGAVGYLLDTVKSR